MQVPMTKQATDFSQRTNFCGEEAEVAARRKRLIQLASRATEALKNEGLSEIGSLSVAPARHDDDWSYFAQIRSGPSSAHAGAELRFPLQRSDPADDHNIITNIISSARRFAQDKEEISAKVEKARRAAQKLIDSTLDLEWPAEIVSIGCEYGYSNILVFDVEVLEYDLNMSRTRVVSRRPDFVVQELGILLDKHEYRADIRIAMKQSGILFLVDGATKSILEAVGLDVTHTIRELGSKRHIDFAVIGTDGHDYDGAIFFKDGVLRADLMSDGNPVRFQTDELTLFDTGIPETLIATLPGRNLGDLIELPWLPADAVITNVQGSSETLYVKIRCPCFGMTEQGLKLCEGFLQPPPLPGS